MTKKSKLTEAFKIIGGVNYTFVDLRKSASGKQHTSSSSVTHQEGPVVKYPVGFVPSTPINIHRHNKM